MAPRLSSKPAQHGFVAVFRPMYFALLLPACALFALTRAESPPAKHSAEQIEQLAAKAIESWNVPGLALAVVHNDRVLCLKGVGLAKADSRDQVTPDTIFPLASCSKAFTTAVMAQLVDEGKLHWDDQVRKHVPFFHLSDPLADDKVTLRDLLCHRTGVAPHDLLWYRGDLERDERVRRLKFLPLKRDFRTTMQYQSSMFTAAGIACERAADTRWDVQMHKRLFEPLGMKRTACTTPAARKLGNLAAPHGFDSRGRIVPIPDYEMEQPEPAGSIYSCARDLVPWLRMHLNQGSVDDQRLVSAKNLAETHEPHVVIRMQGIAKTGNPDTRQISYGLAWVVQDYRGELLVQHAGTIDGFRTHITLVPKHKLGIALFANLQRTQINLALSNMIVDHVLGLPEKDWHAIVQQALKDNAVDIQAKLAERDRKRDRDAKVSLPLERFAGAYDHPAYGTITVKHDGTSLTWCFRDFKLPMEHFEKDTFRIHHENIPECLVTFTIKDDNPMSMHVSDPIELDFRRS